MSEPLTTPCPAWCERQHPIDPGALHRAEIGKVDLRDERLVVVVAQSPGRPPAVHIGGRLFVGFDTLDLDDVRAMFTALGFPFLAQLIEQAQQIVERGRAEWREQQRQDAAARS